MWEVHYSREAATYLEDNGELITHLFFAMEALAESDGIPIVGNFETMQNVIYWAVQSHWVVYGRLESAKIVRIIFIKPTS